MRKNRIEQSLVAQPHKRTACLDRTSVAIIARVLNGPKVRLIAMPCGIKEAKRQSGGCGNRNGNERSRRGDAAGGGAS